VIRVEIAHEHWPGQTRCEWCGLGSNPHTSVQAAREKLLATAMVAILPTDDTTKLRMVLRLVEEAEDALRTSCDDE
jgi:hypothetical protein